MAVDEKREQTLAAEMLHHQPLQGKRLRPIHPSWFALRNATSIKALDPVD